MPTAAAFLAGAVLLAIPQILSAPPQPRRPRAETGGGGAPVGLALVQETPGRVWGKRHLRLCLWAAEDVGLGAGSRPTACSALHKALSSSLGTDDGIRRRRPLRSHFTTENTETQAFKSLVQGHTAAERQDRPQPALCPGGKLDPTGALCVGRATRPPILIGGRASTSGGQSWRPRRALSSGRKQAPPGSSALLLEGAMLTFGGWGRPSFSTSPPRRLSPPSPAPDGPLRWDGDSGGQRADCPGSDPARRRVFLCFLLGPSSGAPPVILQDGGPGERSRPHHTCSGRRARGPAPLPPVT